MIAVIDSGIGGLKILSAICELMPNVHIIGFFDQRYFPYGNQKKQQLLKRCQLIINSLIDQYQITTIVLGCNTITTEMITELRQTYSLPIIGIEPAIKVAAQCSKNKKIGVIGTTMTLKSARYHWLKKNFAKEQYIIDIPCPKLAEWIEKQDDLATKNDLKNIINILEKEKIDTLVLGCTHYLWIQSKIKNLLPNILIVDPSHAVAKQTKHIYLQHKKLTENTQSIKLLTNQNIQMLQNISQKIFSKNTLKNIKVFYCEF